MTRNAPVLSLLVLITAIGSFLTPLRAQSQPADDSAASAVEVTISEAQTQPGSAPALSEDERMERSAALFEEGIRFARAGDFDKAFGSFLRAGEFAPEEAKIAQAIELTRRHRQTAERFRGERVSEYFRAVRRVHNAMLAQAHIAVEDPEAAKAMRKSIQDAKEAYRPAGSSERLAALAPEDAQQMRTRSIEAATKAGAAFAVIAQSISEDEGEYEALLREKLDVLTERMSKQAQAWTAASLDDDEPIKQASDALAELEQPLGDALADVEMLVSEKPWRIALAQGRLARQLYVENKDRLPREAWYGEIMADAEQRGAEFVEQAQWHDALAVYASLEDLDPNNESYKQHVKNVTRHVRMLGLYGPPEALTQNAADSDEDVEVVPQEEPNWKDVVANVDAEMVRMAISKLETEYVTPVEYGKLIRGALNALRVLAETPQAAYSFPSLKDEQRQQEFLSELDSLMAHFDKKTRLDHMELTLALNSALRANDRTIRLPVAVMAVEFAEGFLSELDQFSAMIWPHDMDDFRKQVQGHFYGVGIQITKETGEPLEVVTPLPGSPAFKAGIRPGDVILNVDGKVTEDISVDKLVRMITGERGTKVVLTVQRKGEAEPFDLPLIREEITIRTVKGWQPYSNGDYDYAVDDLDGIGYVRISQFTSETHPAMVEAVKELRAKGTRSLIIDLRFNPGGLLGSAVEISDEFLEGGRKIVSTRGRQPQRELPPASPGGAYTDGDLVLLVNDFSASAAEIVAGALKDWGRAIIVGQRTFGKGSVQNVLPVRHERAMLKLTTAHYYLPSGRLLHRSNGAKEWGVDPDVDCFLTPEQARRWLQIRRETDLLKEVEAEQLQADLTRQYEADIQLQTAVTLLKLMRLQQDQHAEYMAARAGAGGAAQSPSPAAVSAN